MTRLSDVARPAAGSRLKPHPARSASPGSALDSPGRPGGGGPRRPGFSPVTRCPSRNRQASPPASIFRSWRQLRVVHVEAPSLAAEPRNHHPIRLPDALPGEPLPEAAGGISMSISATLLAMRCTRCRPRNECVGERPRQLADWRGSADRPLRREHDSRVHSLEDLEPPRRVGLRLVEPVARRHGVGSI